MVTPAQPGVDRQESLLEEERARDDTVETQVESVREVKLEGNDAWNNYLETLASNSCQRENSKKDKFRGKRNCDDWSLVSLSPVQSPHDAYEMSDDDHNIIAPHKKVSVEVEMHSLTRHGWTSTPTDSYKDYSATVSDMDTLPITSGV